jgi:hypothetical protein
MNACKKKDKAIPEQAVKAHTVVRYHGYYIF